MAEATEPRHIDLNADLGEGFGRWSLTDDDRLLEVVSSANVACGFHAGDPVTLRRVCARAAELDVAVGAQVSFRDLVGFGRRRLECTPAELAADVLYQLGALGAFCAAAGTRVRYVKPHGALYHELAGDPARASAVVEAVGAYDPSLAVLCLPGSALLAAADEQGLRAVREAFPDRAYRPDGGLVDRASSGALITDPADVARRAVEMAATVDSLCIHGDSGAALAAATAVRGALEVAGWAVRSFG